MKTPFFSRRLNRNLLFTLLLLVLFSVSGHSQVLYGKVEVRILQLYSSVQDRNPRQQAEHTWRIRYKDNATEDLSDRRICFAKNSRDQRWFDISEFSNEEYDKTFTVRTYWSGESPRVITLHLEGYENDNGDRCDLDGGDGHQDWTQFDIQLSEIPPGIFSDPQTVMTGINKYGMSYQIRYIPVPPSNLVVPAQVCANKSITLTTSMKIPNKQGLRYEWEYNDGTALENPEYNECIWLCEEEYYGCQGSNCGELYSEYCLPACLTNYPEKLVWRHVGIANDTSHSFNIKDFLPSGLPYTTNFRFRVRAISSGEPSPFSGPSGYTSFQPSPPISTGSIITELSCTERDNGRITLDQIVTPYASYQYRFLLLEGDVPELGCNPLLTHPDCMGATVSLPRTQNTGSTLRLDGIGDGEYSLFLLNNGGDYGMCGERVGTSFLVHPVTALDVSNLTTQNIDCHGTTNGSGVDVTITGGDPSNVLYELSNITAATSQTTNSNTPNATVSFASLAAGTHRLSINDHCTAPVTRTFDVTQPTKVDLIDFEKQNASCTAPGNGSAKITVTRRPDSFTTSLSTLFSYALYHNGTLTGEQETTWNEYLWDKNLAPGTYQLITKEKGSGDCNGHTENFTIDAPPSLSLIDLETNNVKCFNDDDGSIVATAQGGSGAYSYTLEIPGEPASTNSSGEFKNLKAGSYTLVTKNDFECDDEYRQTPILISQPDQLVALAQKTDISCYGLSDGTLTSSVSGRTSNAEYNYAWETNVNSSWIPISIITPSAIGRQDGTYRLRLTDANNTECLAFSNEVEIIEPDKLELTDVIIHDITCFGEEGKLEVKSLGGTAPYFFHYSTNNGNTFSNFQNNQSSFTAGTYKIKVTDNNDCPVTDPQSYHITAPTEPLLFSETLSDFNGFNISCHGGSNGTATLLAGGGNGAIYNGYMYAVDGVFQSEPLLSGINAGPHALAVKDARGCVVSKTLTFTQTTGKLTPQLITKKDVACFGDTDGSLDVNATGGLGPFKFSINGLGNQQDHGLFTGLEVGDYTVSIIDKNNCDNNFTYTITSVNPKIQIAATVSDVNCFNGSDGAIQAFIKGGALPLQYKWNNTLTTSSKVEGLKSGTHALEVIDNAGCKRDSSIVVLQPATALDMKLITIPVCSGRADGTITATGFGGTSPYRYSIDGGQHYQTNQLFTKVKLGKYNVKAEDKNGCTVVQEADVFQRNDRPEPNFLVATKRNALDTLIVTEISVPKPDSIIWDFGTSARLLNENQWAPEIKFEKAGTFAVNMTGFFGGCDYAVTKNIFVSPFDAAGQPEKLPGFKPIERFEVSPNPSSGEFEVMIDLNKKYNVSVIVYDMLGSVHFTKQWEETTSVKQNVQLTNAAAGIYLVRAITESDAKDIRIVIK